MIRRKNKIAMATHFVWATHDRLPLIRPDMECSLARYISKVCLDDKCTMIALAVLPDHVHLLVNLATTISVSNFMMHVKGGSSRFVTQTLKPDGFFGWQNHYGAFSVFMDDMDALLAYIANQKQHHADGSLNDEWEQTFEEYEIEDKTDNP